MVSEIWMNVVVEEKRRGRVMAVYGMMVALGMALGPLVLQVTGVYGPAPFLTCAGLALLVALPLLPYWKTSPEITHSSDSGFGIVLLAAPLALFGAFACGLGEQVAFSFLPVYAVGAGVSAETGALWLSAFVMGNVVLQWPIGWLADHADRRAVLGGCTGASAVLVVVLSLMPAQSFGVIGVVMVWGGISFAIYPVALALLGQSFKGGDIARANTAFSMIYIVGGLIGRAADRRRDGYVRRSRFGRDARGFLHGPPPLPPCWPCAAAADKSSRDERSASCAAAGGRPTRACPGDHPDRIHPCRSSRARRCASGRTAAACRPEGWQVGAARHHRRARASASRP